MPLNIKGCRAKVNQQMKKAVQATEKTQENAVSQATHCLASLPNGRQLPAKLLFKARAIGENTG